MPAQAQHMIPHNFEFLKPLMVTITAFVASIALEHVTTALDWSMQLARFIVIAAMIIGGIRTIHAAVFPKKPPKTD